MPKPPKSVDKKPRKQSTRATPPPPATPPPSAGYEKSDLSLKVMAVSAAVLLAILIAATLLVGLPFSYRISQHRLSDSVVHPGPDLDPTPTFPQPRLQHNDYADMRAFRDQEDKWLGSYRWVDASRGVVAIPIERAMDILAQRGLPVRKERTDVRP